MYLLSPTDGVVYISIDVKWYYLPKKQSVAMLIEKPMATILTSNGNSLRKRDLDTLQDNNRLNDVIIDTYLKMICDRSKNSSNLPKVFAFSTFFCQSIRRYHEYNRILSGFCKKEDLFSFDIIFGMCAKHMIDIHNFQYFDIK